jgi:hypothetical protein
MNTSYSPIGRKNPSKKDTIFSNSGIFHRISHPRSLIHVLKYFHKWRPIRQTVLRGAIDTAESGSLLPPLSLLFEPQKTKIFAEYII